MNYFNILNKCILFHYIPLFVLLKCWNNSHRLSKTIELYLWEWRRINCIKTKIWLTFCSWFHGKFKIFFSEKMIHFRIVLRLFLYPPHTHIMLATDFRIFLFGGFTLYMFKLFIVFSWDQDNFKIEWSRPVVSKELW